jgi:hypothetical protein
MASTLSIETVVNEGAQIYCERRGKGPLLLLIAGAMGDAGFTPLRLRYLLTSSLLFATIDDATLAAQEIELKI